MLNLYALNVFIFSTLISFDILIPAMTQDFVELKFIYFFFTLTLSFILVNRKNKVIMSVVDVYNYYVCDRAQVLVDEIYFGLSFAKNNVVFSVLPAD